MATIKDVARLAGVSPSTASRAMHNSSLISESTKKKVRAAMAELDYSPNFAAQNLANKSSNTIGVILPANEDSVGDNPFFIQIIQGLAAICNAHDYMVSVASGQNNQELIKNIETMIKRGNISRFVFVYSKANDPVLHYVKAQKQVQVVIIGTPYEDKDEMLYVDNDNQKAGYDAAGYLFEKGCKNILYVYTDLDENVQNDRFLGYKKAVKAHKGQTFALSLAFNNEVQRDKAIKDYFKAYPEIDAIIACDDILALQVRYSCESACLDDSIALMGFNNSALGRVMHPTLTSVEIFPRFLGSEAAALAINADDDKLKLDSNYVIVPHKVVERESTK
ncbi:transcriptional regulator, LacI family [Ligilactobacillus sp. WC1T17]|uniref:Transcriptional regulator, LacI family n=1 Tax=Ligilactobacillus ruminis TaxID=1623 RepID=A0ABY1A9A7_9LACO|nr:transcriptional regulator, LacI family [Ligilactobacillus ruminis]